ncbi:MAG: UBP-type zinc finger domain-containing protein [Anaerolineales bacterium]|nr:UBP-type zinc finger domain-containing protein [Anaerolineales bacterium]
MTNRTEPIRRVGIQDLIFRWLFTRSLREKACSHLDMIQNVAQSTDVCQDCVDLGDTWPDLRMCMTCGYIGCCEEAKNQHALKHFKETGHPLIRGLGRNQDFMWCYVDNAVMVPRRVVSS